MSGRIESKSSLDFSAALRKLSIDSNIPQRATPRRESGSKSDGIADSWEDDVELSDHDEPECILSPQQPACFPLAPPPTPISPTTNSFNQQEFNVPYNLYGNDMEISRTERHIKVRPGKTDAIAKRMIAGALGIKQPPKSDEQRAYEAAIVENEFKRRNKEKQNRITAQKEAERSRKAVWNDDL